MNANETSLNLGNNMKKKVKVGRQHGALAYTKQPNLLNCETTTYICVMYDEWFSYLVFISFKRTQVFISNGKALYLTLSH